MKKLKIVILGKQGAGKSASGNTLLGCYPFHMVAGSERATRACSMRISTVDEQTIEVIDTPGWCDYSQIETETKQEIINYIIMCKPHVFLLVLTIGRFTNEEINTVMDILKEFGDEVRKYMIVLFTKGDELEDRSIKDYLKDVHPDLKKIIQIFGERYHVFNNRDKKDHQQISSLLKKINELVEKNEEKWYTKAMYEKNKTDQGSSCDADEKEKEKGETLVDRKELEKVKKNMDELTKTIQNTEQTFIKDMGQCKNGIQKLERELKKTEGELFKTKNELEALQQKVYQNEQLQQEHEKCKEMHSKPK